MVINALNSKANGYMLDLEDSMAPSWKNVIGAHTNIMNAVRNNLTAKKFNNEGNVIKEYKIDNNELPSFFISFRIDRIKVIHISIKPTLTFWTNIKNYIIFFYFCGRSTILYYI